jgi:hypothetical protein
MSSRSSGLKLALLGLLAAGCVHSTHPLSDEKTSVPDLRLLGEWEYRSGPDETVQLHVRLKEGSETVLEVVGSDKNERLEDKNERLELLLTKLGEHHYASVLDETADETGARYLIARYELTDENVVKIWALDLDFFASKVESGELKGEVRRSKFFRDVMLNETPERLAAFLQKYGDKCLAKDDATIVTRAQRGPERQPDNQLQSTPATDAP